MGINTVDLKGEPFTLYVEEGQKVARGQLIALVDLAAIQSAGKNTDMVVVFTRIRLCWKQSRFYHLLLHHVRV